MSGDQWYCKVVGQEVGPISVDDLREMLERGQIDPTDAVRQGRTGLWRPYEEVFSEQSSLNESVATAVEPTWFFRTLGEEFGPYTIEELREFVAQDQLSRKDKVREGRTGSWSRAKQIPGLFPTRRDENRDLLSDFSLLEDAEPEAEETVEPEDAAEPEAPPRRKPVPGGGSSKSGRKRRSSRNDADEDLAAELLGGPDEPLAAGPSRHSSAPTEDRSLSPAATASNAIVDRDEPPTPAATAPPPPRYTPPPPPPRSYSSSGKSSGGGIGLPSIDFAGTPVKVVAGLAVLLIGGYFLMNMGFLGSVAAGSVYDSTSVLHQQFNKLHENPKSPEYEAFYTQFKTEQTGLLAKLGNPSPGSTARDVKFALLTLGSAIEAYHRPDMEKAERESYKASADEAMSRLKQEFGR